MHVCICDCGIGIQESFRRSHSSHMRDISATTKDWIQHATEPLVTSKAEGHAGYGLYLVRELCRLNGGYFVIVSGDAAYRISPSNPATLESDLETVDTLPYRWPGTLVAMQFRLDRPLELGPIYGKIPMPGGDESPTMNVDLFDE